MNIDTIITQLRTNSTMFPLIAGAAEYSALSNEVNPAAFPALYVIPLEDTCELNPNQGFLRQQVYETIAVIVMLDNTLDRRGQTAVTSIEAIKYELYSLLLYYRPPELLARTIGGLSYAGGSLTGRDFARLEWEFRFTLRVTITHYDGWQIPETPINSVTIIDTSLPGVVSQPAINVLDDYGATVQIPQD